MLRYAPLILALLLLVGCGRQSPSQPILDLIKYEQDAGAYHGLDPDARLLSVRTQQAAYERFLEAHFAPWDRDAPKHTAEEVFWGISVFGKKRLYGENTLPRDPEWMASMAGASRMGEYPSMARRAVTVTNTSMRTLPTQYPAFLSFARAGEGFPFDYMQNSLVLAGTPLLATHTSTDKRWVLVESRFAFGWVQATDIAWVNDDFATAFRTGSYATLVADNVPVASDKGLFHFLAYIGTLLPVADGGSGENGPFIVPARDARGNAVPALASLPQKTIRQAPLAATPANFTAIANRMMGMQYGWGGLYENRDCSATIMDMMAAFGIFLPRNSTQQIKAGTRVSLKGMSVEKKKEAIIEKGTPFLTLVHRPGHIMLYVGRQDGQPLVLHSAWGVKTRKNHGYGRKIIGATVITTLEPGRELDTLARPEGVFLEKVQTISTLP